MVTVFQRCIHFGFSDYITSSLSGQLVADDFIKRNLHGRILTESVEPSGTFSVWAYPNEHVPVIDEFIRQANAIINARVQFNKTTTTLESIRPKRKRIERRG